ncbi:uncharacterized protein LOC119401442 [Rhipicephalus sanguineus]|uniref:uncharacterized protein LOC119401442 n=1 Tax=Rhipicephalus sanguineus TaxID=34632 RepID=UPI0018935712|nr:uncharacterized protein LOC119401442 [Rhipicephalus sanguineus]
MPKRKKTTAVGDTSECTARSAEKEKPAQEESGFPDDELDTLISAVDTIVLCVEDRKHIRIPEGCVFNPDLRRVYTDPKTLVARKEAFANIGVSGAVFAGCAAFSSSKPYRRAAMSVLATARYLCIVHNRDNVCKLASWFPSVTDLTLPHNLAFRSVCSRQDCDSHSGRKSSLERIAGDAPALGSTNLELDEPLLSDCLLMLPKIVSVHAALDAVLHVWDVISSDDVVLDDMDSAYLRKCPEVILGSWRELPGSAPSYRDTGVAEIECAGRFCPAVKKLEVVFAKKQVLSAVADYKYLTSLSLKFAGEGKCDVIGTNLMKIVKKLVDLERLDLQFFSNIDLREIAKNCPKLADLSLHGCTHVSVDVENEELLPKHLASLRMGLPISPVDHFVMPFTLLTCNRDTLIDLQIEGGVASKVFLEICCRTQFPSLRRLTLDTDKSVRGLCIPPQNLHDVVKNLPALKFLVTDSYDLRLFFEYYVPAVSISWCVCTVCMVERSRQHLGDG